mmetsp:Transcript_3069/g.6754  ORF Transcript_3069/g.6754 Transcript_3069/m.6754 type:complete len:334 (-) Transcript_3069:207-1208(-)
MQSYTDNFGDMVSQPQIVTSCTVIGQDLAARRRRSLLGSLFERLLQPATDVLLVMTFTIQYESRYGYDVDDYPQRFQAYINNNLEQITEDMAARFLPVIEAREVIVFNSNEPTEAPTEIATTNRNYCGASQEDAQNRCAMAIPCPDGSDIVCLIGQECYQISGPCNAASQGNFNSETIASPISPAPIQTTPSPSISPTDNPTDWRTFDRNTTHFCGIDYEDVVKNCYKNRPCPTETDGECPGNQTCFLDIAFANENCNTPQPTTSLTPSYYVVTDGPTPSPTTAPPTMEPTFTPTEGYFGDDFNGVDNCMSIPSFLLQSLLVKFIVWGVLVLL